MADTLSSIGYKPKITNYDSTDADFVALTGVSQTLFPDVTYDPAQPNTVRAGGNLARVPHMGVFQERWVYNPNASGSFWINLAGGVAVANGDDCVEIPPGTGWSGSLQNKITIIGTAAAKITYGQR
jgi:hypothetical protein